MSETNPNRFKELADEIYELYRALYVSGFTNDQAFEIAKQYCSVAFVNRSIENYYGYHNYKSKRDITERFRQLTQERKNELGTEEEKNG